MSVSLLWGLFFLQVSRCFHCHWENKHSMLQKSSFFLLFFNCCGYTASHGILASLIGAVNVWDTFASPLPQFRMSSADPKRAAQSPDMLPNCSAVPGESQTTKDSRPPTCRIRTMTSSVYLHLSLHPSSSQDLNCEVWYETNMCEKIFEVESHCTEAIPLSQLQQMRSIGIEIHHNWRFPREQ